MDFSCIDIILLFFKLDKLGNTFLIMRYLIVNVLFYIFLIDNKILTSFQFLDPQISIFNCINIISDIAIKLINQQTSKLLVKHKPILIVLISGQDENLIKAKMTIKPNQFVRNAKQSILLFLIPFVTILLYFDLCLIMFHIFIFYI